MVDQQKLVELYLDDCICAVTQPHHEWKLLTSKACTCMLHLAVPPGLKPLADVFMSKGFASMPTCAGDL